MIILLYTGFLVGLIVAVVIFVKQTKKIHRRFKNESKMRTLMTSYIIKDMILGFLIMIIISFLIPYLIWTIGDKDMREVEMITTENELHSFGDGSYIKEEVNDNGEVYVLNEEGWSASSSYEKYYSKQKNIEFIEGSKTPKYQEILVYKIESLDEKNPINKLVNNMFANIYMENKDAQYVKSIVRIYLP